jgi:hypothetical protein
MLRSLWVLENVITSYTWLDVLVSNLIIPYYFPGECGGLSVPSFVTSRIAAPMGSSFSFKGAILSVPVRVVGCPLCVRVTDVKYNL